jgi:hypothetical protein
LIIMETKILIGKYTLESLTTGMYLSPMDVYREYVQNASDSIDEAISEKIIEKKDAKIIIEIGENNISIIDNGVGISLANAVSTLVDIGNSKKDYQKSRGFRGIGRLSGLGYCDFLKFTTSALGESSKTVISFNAKLLQELLLPNEGKQESLNDVLERVVSTKRESEESNKHYLVVKMINVSGKNDLLDYEKVRNYLIQNLPLPFSSDFIWGSMIEEKIKLFDVFIPKYTVILKRNNKREQLFKPYKNNILSDRVRRVEDPIKDIQVKPFYVNDELCAVLWYVIDNYYGTILDSQIKGIRIRKGNILFGDKNSLRHNFKEERFNGWLCGELYIVSNRIIPNARRDDFEKNQEYLNLNEQIKKWTKDISKTIRSISYERNLSEEDNKLINSVNTGDFENAKQIEKKPTLGEGQLLDLNDSQEIAKSDLFNSLSILANINNNVTKYKSINLSNKLTREQKRTYEEIFDLLYEKLSKRTANRVVQIIIDNLVE